MKKSTKGETSRVLGSLILSGVVTARVGWALISVLMAMKVQTYRARRPKLSPLWQCLAAHFDASLDIYPETYEHEYGFLRPIISEVVMKFMDCGDFAKGFARVR